MALRSTLLASAIVLGSATQAHAAPAPACVPASITPRAASVPANLPAFGYDALKAEAKDVKLTVTTTQANVPLTVGPVEGNLIRVAPTTALVAGTSYELSYATFCQYGGVPGKPITFTATPAAPIPTRIADANAGPATVTVKDYGTSKVTIQKDYSVAPEMKPWIDVYEIALLLDGRALETKSTMSGNNSIMVITATGWCDATNGATNTHKLQLRAKLPFSPTLLEKELSQDFACPAPKITTAPPANPTAPTTPPSLPPGSTTSTPSSSNDGSGVSTCSMASPRIAATPFALVAIGLSLLSFRRRARK